MMLSPEQIAKRIGMTPAYVRSLCTKGEIIAHKMGKFWRVEEAEYEAWLARTKLPALAPTNVISIGGRR